LPINPPLLALRRTDAVNEPLAILCGSLPSPRAKGIAGQ
jgi:hypothetical protein